MKNLSVKKKEGKDGSRGLGALIASVLRIIGQVIETVGRLLYRVLIPIIGIIAFVLVLATVVAWMASSATLLVGSPFLSAAYGQSVLPSVLSVVGLLILITVPTLALVLLFFRLFFKKRVAQRVHYGIWGLWSLAIIGLVGLGTFLGTQFSTQNNFNGTSQDFSLTNDTLYLDLFRPEMEDEIKISGDFGFANSDGIWLKQVKVNLHASSAVNEVSLVPEYSSRGPNRLQAEAFAKAVEWQPVFEGNRLQVPAFMSIPRGTPWRNQFITLNVTVPEGKTIIFNDHFVEPNSQLLSSTVAKRNWELATHGRDVYRVTRSSDGETVSFRPGDVWKVEGLAL